MARSGPHAFQDVPMLNQRIWDTDATRIDEFICDALARAGFGEDTIRRQVGNYEGQIAAIRRGLVDAEVFGWRINDAGRAFLRFHASAVPTTLPVLDSWHSSDAQYCMYEKTHRDKPVLQFAEKLIPQGQNVCMCPLFRKEDAKALRDYLNDWLSRT